jgi:hypothetical protein
MAAETLAWPSPPTLTDENDAGQSYGLGCAFSVSEAVECTGIRWHVPDTVSSPPGGSHIAAVYVNGVRQRFAAFVPVPGGDQDITFSSPITLNPGESCVASVFTVHYTFRAGAAIFPVSTPGGQATATASRLTATSTPADLPDVAGTAIFYVSPIIDNGEADEVTLSGTLTLPALTLSGTLTSTAPPALSGTLTLPKLTLTGTLINASEPDPGAEHAHGFPLRAELAELLSTVSGVHGYERRPSGARTGDAWPRLTRLEHVAPGAWQTEWQIVVLLPQDEARQDAWIIERLEALTDALAPAVWVTGVEPGASSDSPALLINCRE